MAGDVGREGRSDKIVLLKGDPIFCQYPVHTTHFGLRIVRLVVPGKNRHFVNQFRRRVVLDKGAVVVSIGIDVDVAMPSVGRNRLGSNQFD